MKQLTTLNADELENVTGGFDIAGLVMKGAGLFDKLTGGKHNIAGTAGSLMQTIASFKKGGGGGETQQA